MFCSIEETLWHVVEGEINHLLHEVEKRGEFSVMAAVPFKRSDSVDVLFDSVDEELHHPTRKLRNYKEYLPTSALRVIDSVNLEKIFSKLGNAALQEAQDLEHLSRIDNFKILVSDSPKEKPVYIKPAPISKRLLGCIADFSLCLMLGVIFSSFLFLPPHVSSAFCSFSLPSFHNLLPHIFDIFGLSYLIWIIVSVVLTAGGGQSPGQSLTKVMVVSPAGNIISFAQAFLRALSQTTAIITFGMSALPALGKKGQAVHEFLSNTYVAEVSTFEQIQLDKVYGNSSAKNANST